MKNYNAWRDEGISSEDIPIIMGDNRKKTIYDLWCEKIGERREDHGKEWTFAQAEKLRAQAIGHYELIKDETFKRGLIGLNNNNKFMRSYIDLYRDDFSLGMKFKYCGENQMKIARRKIITQPVNLAVQYEMLVTGLQSIDVLMFDGNEGVIVNVMPDKELMGEIYIAVNAFWYGHVLSFTPPKITSKDLKRAVKHNANTTHLKARIMDLQGEIEEIKRSKVDL